MVATGSRYRHDGWQGQTAAPLAGWETGNCLTWYDVASGKANASGSVVVVDDLQDIAGPLTAVKLARAGASGEARNPLADGGHGDDARGVLPLDTSCADRGPGWRSSPISSQAGSTEPTSSSSTSTRRIVYPDSLLTRSSSTRRRQSENRLYHALRERGISVEAVGDAIAPRGTYEAVYEGHRAARNLAIMISMRCAGTWA